MPFLDWRKIDDSKRLGLIEAGADMCLRHAKALTARPPYETHAEDYLGRCERVLRRSLIDVRRAQALYRRTRVDA